MAHKRFTVEDAARIWQQAFATVDHALDSARSDSATPPGALIDAWIAQRSHPALPQHPLRRPAASLAEIAAAEARLGIVLPETLKALYLETNGLDWLANPNPYSDSSFHCGGHFPPLDRLVFAGQLAEPLSKFLLRHWKQYRKRRHEPQSIELFPPGALTHVFGMPEKIFAFAELDRFLCLQPPCDSGCLLLAHCDDLGVARDSVLDVENGLAVRYANLAHWLSAQIKLYTVSLSPLGNAAQQ